MHILVECHASWAAMDISSFGTFHHFLTNLLRGFRHLMELVEEQMHTPVVRPSTNVVRNMVHAKTSQNTVFFLTIGNLGWCGDTDGHCLPANGCQAGFGQCATVATTTAPPPVTTTTTTPPVTTTITLPPPIAGGSCGTQGGGGICITGQCCSESGWCGTTPDYCISPGCQIGFGTCDAEYVLSGVPSSARREV